MALTSARLALNPDAKVFVPKDETASDMKIRFKEQDNAFALKLKRPVEQIKHQNDVSGLTLRRGLQLRIAKMKEEKATFQAREKCVLQKDFDFDKMRFSMLQYDFRCPEKCSKCEGVMYRYCIFFANGTTGILDMTKCSCDEKYKTGLVSLEIR
jgi:hypothetical protein